MLAVAVLGRAAEHRDDDLGPKPPHDPHDVLEDGVLGPVLPGLVQRLGVAEIVGAGEILPRAVEPPRGQQLLGPDEPERLAQLRADEVLSPLAAVEGQVRGFRPHAPDEYRQQLGVLVVRMGPDHQHAPVVPQHAQLLVQRDDARRCRAARAGRAGSTAGARRSESEKAKTRGECEAQRDPRGRVSREWPESYTVPGLDSKATRLSGAGRPRGACPGWSAGTPDAGSRGTGPC